MKLAELNDSGSLLVPALADMLPATSLRRIVTASRLSLAQPHSVPNGIIDEAFLGNLMYGGLMRLRAALNGLPSAIAKNPRVIAHMKRAEEAKGSLLDDTNANWWLGLVGVFSGLFTNQRTGQPIRPYQELANAIKQKVADEAGQWADNTADRAATQDDQAGFNAGYNNLKTQAKRNYQVKQLLARYGLGQQPDTGMNPRNTARNGLAAPSLNKLNPADRRRLIKLLKKNGLLKKKLAKRAAGALTMPATEAAMVVAAAAGQLAMVESWLQKTASGLRSGTARMLDLFNPKRRAAIGQGYVARSQNKLIAALAIKAAYDMANELSARHSAGGLAQVEPVRPGRQATTMAPSKRATYLPHGGASREPRK